jgi:tetratricopeptide (TPR) repeat protein
MKKIGELIASLNERLFSNTYQLQRLVILTAIVLGLAIAGFGGYYYYDRYYTSQPKVAQVSISSAEEAVAKDPQDPEKRLALAETYMLNRRFNDAIVQAQEVMSVYPDNQHAWLVLGIANALNGNPTNAVDPLQKFVDANKDSDMPGLNKALVSAAYYLGDSYLQLGQPDKAVPVLEMDVEWSQTDADAMYKLGMAYLGVQTYDKAVNMFLNATAFVPNYTEAYVGMTTAFQALNEPDLANYSLGMQAFSKKDYKTALTLLLQSAQARPDFAPTFAGLGMTYEAMNDLEKAKSSYEAAIKLDPTNFTAITGLQRVEALLKK